MNNQTTNAAEHQIIKQMINIWTAQNKVVTDFFNKHPDEVYTKEVAPAATVLSICSVISLAPAMA